VASAHGRREDKRKTGTDGSGRLQCRVRSRGRSLLDHLLCALGTAATTGGHAQRRAKIVQRRSTVRDCVANLVFCNSIAETDVQR